MASFYNKLIRSLDGSEELNMYNTSGSEDDENEDTDKVQEVHVKSGGSKSHAKLMEAISSLDTKKRQKTMQRSEASREASEFNFSDPDGKNQNVMMHELMGSLANTPRHSELKKQLSNVQRNQKVLDAPLHRHEEEKVRRTVAYEAASKEVSRWDQVVQTNRKAEQLSFPLNQPVIGIQTTDQFVKKFKPSTPLEHEVYKMLHGSKHHERPNKELTLAEEEALTSLSLEEAQERRAELQKTRALLSYYEAKCHRRKKIKSKMYHRIQRKSKAKNEAEKLSDGIRADPNQAEEVLLDLDKARAKERVTLKHRNTGKWAKGMMRFGKYDQKARSLLAEQLQKSHELTKKISEANDDAADTNSTMQNSRNESGANAAPEVSLSGINNPWFTKSITATEETNVQAEVATLEPVSGHVTQEESDSDCDTDGDVIDRLFEEDNSKKHTDVMNSNLRNEENDNGLDRLDESQSLEEHFHQDETLINEKPTQEHNVEPSNLSDLDGNAKSTGKRSKNLPLPSDKIRKKTVADRQKKEIDTFVDVSKMLRTKATDVQSAAPVLIVNEQVADATSQHLLNIQEAFAEDDIVKIFQEEKQERVDQDKSKDVDLSLPGWGSWGGAGVKPKKKVGRFQVKRKAAQPRRDENLQHVLINDSRDKKAAVHQVNQLPFPYSTPEQFQRSIRAPIGSTWNTPSTVKQLTIPKVTTKLGAIIEPITAAEAFKQTRKRKVDKSQSGKQPQMHMDLVLSERQHPKKKSKEGCKK